MTFEQAQNKPKSGDLRREKAFEGKADRTTETREQKAGREWKEMFREEITELREARDELSDLKAERKSVLAKIVEYNNLKTKKGFEKKASEKIAELEDNFDEIEKDIESVQKEIDELACFEMSSSEERLEELNDVNIEIALTKKMIQLAQEAKRLDDDERYQEFISAFGEDKIREMLDIQPGAFFNIDDLAESINTVISSLDSKLSALAKKAVELKVFIPIQKGSDSERVFNWKQQKQSAGQTLYNLGKIQESGKAKNKKLLENEIRRAERSRDEASDVILDEAA